MNTAHDFVKVVRRNTLLTKAQRVELADPDYFSEAYRSHILNVLRRFDTQAVERDQRVRRSLEESYVRFKQSLVKEGVPKEIQQEYLDKARKQIEEFFPKD